jgi:UDP-N-acetyl-2-amino-2-deoxyglucuronate dehydrogenase
MSDRLRIGVSGSGFMGRTHVDAAEKLGSTQPVAITGGSRAATLATDYGIAHEPDFASLVARDDIDAVVIATPHWLHCEEALQAAAAGKHALVEKPMATTLADCDRMAAAFSERNLVLSLGYHQRFRESNYRTRDLIQSGAIGTVRCLQMSALFDIEAMRSDDGFGGAWGWWKDPRSIAHLINSAPHNIDLCRWWLNDDLYSVAAQSGTFREENPNENTTMSLLRFTQGTMATYWSSSVLPAPGFAGEEFRFRIMGDLGIIDLNPYGDVQLGRAGEVEIVHSQPPVGHEDSNTAFSLNRMQAYCDQMDNFAQAIHGGAEAMATGEGKPADGRAGVAAVLAMLESANSETIVKL